MLTDGVLDSARAAVEAIAASVAVPAAAELERTDQAVAKLQPTRDPGRAA